MAIKKTNDKNYYDIADAIRAKNGKETLYKPDEMASAIEAIPEGTAFGTPEAYGAVGDGITDDTEAINSCLAENKMILFKNIYLINPVANTLDDVTLRYGINIPSNRILIFEKNAKLICAETGSNNYDAVLLYEKSNIIIKGMTLHGNRSTELPIDHPRDTCNGLGIRGCENIYIDSATVDDFIGDGVAIWVSGNQEVAGEYTICKDITLSDCKVFGNRRNGITIGGIDGFYAQSCEIYNNGLPVEYGGDDSSSAQPPQAGVDIEPDFDHVPVKNVVFETCVFYGNGGFDIINQNGTQERFSMIHCDCLGGDGLYQGNIGALFRASNVNVTGGHYRRIGIGSNVAAAIINGAYVNEIMSAITAQGIAVFDGCMVDGLLNDGVTSATIKTDGQNAICELKNSVIRNCFTNTGFNTGTISLEGCYIEQPQGQWMNNGHLQAKNTEFHFEGNTTANVIWAVTNEFIDCDFFYTNEPSLFIHTNDATTAKLWYNNRFHNSIASLSPKANLLIKNWFNFPSTKIAASATGERIGNIFTDTNGFVTEENKTTWNGKYSKPNGGIPKTDLDNSVQASLNKADTALQTEQYTGTITGITMNGKSKGTSGVVNLGTVITAHQNISGKENISNKVTSISSSSTNEQYPSAKCVYDLVGDIETLLSQI